MAKWTIVFDTVPFNIAGDRFTTHATAVTEDGQELLSTSVCFEYTNQEDISESLSWLIKTASKKAAIL